MGRSSLYLILKMKKTLLILIVVALCNCSVDVEELASHNSLKDGLMQDPAFFWGDNQGKNYLTQNRNQNVPNYCNSGWAFAIASSISDTIKIMREAAFPDANINVQSLLDCDTTNNGCQGGDVAKSLNYIKSNTLTDETCAPYAAISYKEGRKCTDFSLCTECPPGGKSCVVPQTFKKYNINNFDSIASKDTYTMQMNIKNTGPIVCAINSQPIKNYKKEDGIIKSTDQGPSDHYVSIAGWGTDPSTLRYWIVRNSWGEYWGDNGWAKIAMGTNVLNIESDCFTIDVKKTWTEEDFAEKKENKANKTIKGLFRAKVTEE